MSTRLPDTIQDFVAAYFPAIGALTDAQIQSARSRAEAWLRAGFPDEDLRPNSLLGDRALTPMAHLIAGLEVALQRVASDLDTENVAAGTIYNCDFVNRYLTNFGVMNRTNLPSRGVVRLTFNSDVAVELDRSTQFQFGSEVYGMLLPFSGLLRILPVGVPATVHTNAVTLTDMSDGTFAANIFVGSNQKSTVQAGDTAALNSVIPTLVSASALVDFDPGIAPTGTSDAARRTRDSVVAATPASRDGLMRMLRREFPDLIGAFVSLPGDMVNLRSTVSPLGFGSPALDVWIHSRGYGNRQVQRVFVPYVTTQPAALTPTLVSPKFLAKLSLVSSPLRIASVTSVDNPGVSWIPKTTPGISIYSRSRGGAKAPLLTAAGTSYEELWVAMDMPQRDAGGDAIGTAIVNGVRGAYFDVAYDSDPLLPAVQQVLEGTAYRAAGLDVLVRPAVPIELQRFSVSYTKLTGASVNLTAARADIAKLLRNSAGYAPFAVSQLIDIMFYYQARDVRSISVDGFAHFSAADQLIKTQNNPPELDVDFETAIADAIPVPSYRTSTVGSLTPGNFVDPALGTGSETLAALSTGAVSFLLEDPVITFTQV